MNKIPEYNINGTMIIGVDAGYGNYKTAHTSFPTGIIKSDKAPIFTREFIKYDAFADRIVNGVEKKFLSNLPAILGSFFMNQYQSLSVSPIRPVKASTESDNESDPEENDLIDFDAFG